MDLKRRRRRTAVIAAFLMTGAIVLQVGPFCSLAANTGVAALDLGPLLYPNGSLFGVFNLCGNPDVVNVDATGATISTVGFADDLVFNCPVTFNTVTTTGGTSGGGGGT